VRADLVSFGVVVGMELKTINAKIPISCKPKGGGMIPNEIQREHIVSALNQIDEEGYPNKPPVSGPVTQSRKS
jgi:hypothetical protein